MSIRDKEGKLAISPGSWHVTEMIYNKKSQPHEIKSNEGFVICDGFYWNNNGRADSGLIAEAGTLANKYDATPAEMVEAIRELRTAFFFIDDPNRHEWIAKVLEKTAKYEETK